MNPSDGGQKGKQLSDEVPVVWMLKAPKKSQHPVSVLGDASFPPSGCLLMARWAGMGS